VRVQQSGNYLWLAAATVLVIHHVRGLTLHQYSVGVRVGLRLVAIATMGGRPLLVSGILCRKRVGRGVGCWCELWAGGDRMSADAAANDGQVAAVGPETEEAVRPDHAMFLHWLPWSLPVVAILGPEVILLMIQVGRTNSDLAGQSVNNGELLIPVAIICGEAFLRWFGTNFNNPVAGFFAGFFAVASAGGAIIAAIACTIILSSASAAGYATLADVLTWVLFGCGLVSSTIATVQTRPRNNKTPRSRKKKASL
jgi:hypothetical protein